MVVRRGGLEEASGEWKGDRGEGGGGSGEGDRWKGKEKEGT